MSQADDRFPAEDDAWERRRAGWPACVVPPSPELEERIVASKARIAAGRELPDQPRADVLDARSFALIIGRPAKTRPDTFVEPAPQPSVTGTRRVLVLLVDFSDAAATQTQAHYDELLFSVDSFATGSMRDYFREASYSTLDVVGEVSGAGGPSAGWYRAPEPKTHYTHGDYGFGVYPRNAQRLVEDVIALADPHVDFSQYDNDGDGVVDALVVITAGVGAEVTGNVDDLWSHKWDIAPQTRDGVQIRSYFMAPEDGRVGVMSHELGHLLMRWPDLYDTDYSSAGTGRWDLMAGGSWNNGGDTPAHPTAWCKAKAGWVDPTVLSGVEQDIILHPYATNAQVYKLPIGVASSKEYYLLSNRQQSAFDAHIPGAGMLIEHVDDNRMNNTDENHYLVDIEQADGQRHLNTNANRGDGADAYPLSGNNAFTPATTPNSRSYDGTDSKITITDITRSGADVTAHVNAGGVPARQWANNRSVLATYAHHTGQWAWANIDGIGWRRIKDGEADGVTRLFDLFCSARAHSRPVNVDVDAMFIYTAYLV